MQRERFWFGTALLAVPLGVLLFLAVPAQSRSTRGGSIEGHVIVHGRPMSGGFVVFWPQDLDANVAVGTIDAHGHFVVNSRYLRTQGGSESLFRICLIPKGKPFITSLAADVSRHLGNPQTSSLEVHLGPEPAQVDITL